MGDIMEKSYITRRIDELGRLVIPKEIRRNLKIRDNDQLEINVIDNKIILNKYENPSKDNIISILLSSLKKLFNCNVLYTNIDIIIDYTLLNNKKIINKELNEDIVNIIEKRKIVILDNYIIDDSSYSVIINPIILHGDLLG